MSVHGLHVGHVLDLYCQSDLVDTQPVIIMSIQRGVTVSSEGTVLVISYCSHDYNDVIRRGLERWERD